MQRTNGQMKYPGMRVFMLLAAFLLMGAMFMSASAQTVFSTMPILPLRKPEAAVGMPAASSVLQSVVKDDSGVERAFHIPLILNESVENQIEFFNTSGRAVFQSWLRRSARYLPLMKQILREYNLPEDLVYIAMIESGFNPHAVSPQKAVGPWQFMPATAGDYGLIVDRWVDERKDPVKSTRAAAAHLKGLYNTFGSWLMALASYNAGTGRMQGAALKAQSDDFWDICASRILHVETREYVPRYLAALIIAKNAPAYGFTDPELEPFEFDEVVIPRSTDLRKIARYAGSTYEELRDLNPELLRSATPRNRYVLRLPPGTAESYNRQIARESGRERRAQAATRRDAGKNGTPSLKASPEAPALAGRKNAPIVSRYAAELNYDHITPEFTEALLSSDRPLFPVLR